MPIDVVGALVGWLVQVGGGVGIGMVRGSPDERALHRAVEYAVESVVVQADPASREALRLGLRQCFSTAPQLYLDASASVGDGLRAAIAAQVTWLDQMVNIDTGRPFYQDVSVNPGWLTAQVTEAVITALRHVVAQGGLAELVHGLNASDVYAQLNTIGLQISQLNAPAAATRTLPRDIASFTGRRTDLDRLMQALTVTAAPGGVVGIHAIDGMAGVGKTAFAVHAAHRLAPRFPDGQIFLSLNAHTPGQLPVDPAEALATLLLTTGIAAQQIPPGVEARTGLWRDHLVGKRLLLLLDDAAGSEQVRPLLPGTDSCLVLVTSRRRLTALDAAVPISLDTLPPDEAAELFIRTARRPELHTTDSAVGELVRLCGYLPLAVRLTAGRLSHRPTWTPGDLTAGLATEHDRLAILREEEVSVAAAFDLSYRDLDSQQQRLFRRLGVHFGADFDDYAAAALDKTDLHTTRRLLSDLYDHHLIDEPARGRYRFHDLIREHARTLAAADQIADRDAAIDRLLDYYLHTAAKAGRDLAWNTPETPAATGNPPTCAPELATRTQAIIWLEAERPNLYAASDYAALHARSLHAIGIPFAIHGFLRTNGHWDQALTLHHSALTTARKIDNRSDQASALCQLGAVQRLTGDYPAATTSQNQALELYRDLGDRVGELDALTELGTVQWLMDEYPAATITLTKALDMCRERQQPRGEADVLCQLGAVQRLTGDYPAATTSFSQALELYRDLDDRLGEVDALHQLGVMQRLTGDYPAATTTLSQTLALYRDLRSQPGEADALNNLGDVQKAVRDYPAATTSQQQALTLYRSLGNRRGESEALNNLGELLSESSASADARALHEAALSTARSISAPLEEARALEGIGRCALKQGQTAKGTEQLRQAFTIYQRIGSPNTRRVEYILRDLRL